MPAVSVVVATRNYGRYLAGAVRSVLEQTFADLEVVVVDDGSTDDTPDVVRPLLADPRVRYLRTDGLGQSRAKNLGVLQARGPARRLPRRRRRVAPPSSNANSRCSPTRPSASSTAGGR